MCAACWATATCWAPSPCRSPCRRPSPTHLPLLQQVFGSTVLSWQDWVKVMAAGAMVFVVAEFEKFVIRRLGMADRLASL